MMSEKDKTIETTAGTMKPRMTPIPATPALEGAVAGPGSVQFSAMATREIQKNAASIQIQRDARWGAENEGRWRWQDERAD